MKIAFISEGDAANVLTEYSHCLNKHAKNIESKSICTIPHPFNYEIPHDYNLNNCTAPQLQEAKDWIEDSDVIIFNEESAVNGQYRTLGLINHILGVDLINSSKRLMSWHPGTNYRRNHVYYNNHPHRSKIEKHLYAIDLHRLSDKKENDLILPPYQYFEFNKQEFIDKFLKKLNSEKPLITHIPSSIYKGTQQIKEALQSIDSDKYEVRFAKGLPYSEVMKLKEESLFYIDQFYPDSGSYGIAALEGLVKSNFTFSTLNKITNTIYNLYGEDFPIANLGPTTETMQKVLEFYLLKISKEELEERIYEIANWIETFLTPQYIVNKFNTEILA